MNSRQYAGLAILAGAFSVLAAEAQGQHQGDVLIGVSSGGQLRLDQVPSTPLVLPPVNSGPFFGWASNTLGFDAFVEADAENDIYAVGAGVDISIEVVSIDPGISIRSFTASLRSTSMSPANVYESAAPGSCTGTPSYLLMATT
jgi:hypothetical protein